MGSEDAKENERLLWTLNERSLNTQQSILKLSEDMKEMSAEQNARLDKILEQINLRIGRQEKEFEDRIAKMEKETEIKFLDQNSKIQLLDKKVTDNYVTNIEFGPVKKIVFGLVGLILVAVVGAILVQAGVGG